MVQIRAGFSILFFLLGLWATPGVSQEEEVFNLSIKNGKMAGDAKVIRVKQGGSVKINWTTDEATEIHLHGYDMTKALKPGKTTSMTFKAHATGRFSIVSHGFGKHTRGKHKEEIPLLYLEVHPR